MSEMFRARPDREVDIEEGSHTEGQPADADDAGSGTITPMRRAMRRLARNPTAMVGLAFIVLMIVVAIIGPSLVTHDPAVQDSPPFEPVSAAHVLGTDDLGRDTFSRLVYGTRVSVRSGFETVLMALAVAIPIGLVAGFRGGWSDNVLLRVMDALASFPALVLALAIAAVLGPGLGNAMIAITIVLVPGFVRLIRAQSLAVSQETFVEASRAIGTRTSVILRRRVFPSVASPLIVAVSLTLGSALLAEASLSFLGFGVQPPGSSWGQMLRQGDNYIFSEPFQMIPPGVAIALAVLAFNLLGDGLRDAFGLAEPRPPKRTGRSPLGVTLVSPVRVASASVGSTLSSLDSRVSLPEQLLRVRNLSVEFGTPSGPVTVVDQVSFDVAPGEIVALVGESGSGKTVTSLAIMRLLTSPPARITSGEVLFGDSDLLVLPARDLRAVRGSSLSMVFQDAMSSLNPAFTIGEQLIEAVRWHRTASRSVATSRAVELLHLVGIPAGRARLGDYPHQLSGGMRQRVLIAMALANDPRLVIADEPTTALDVTVQARILDLLRSLQSELRMAMIFVTHDLGVVADICDRVVVLYAGHVVEEAPVRDLFASPKHPYTKALLTTIPQVTPPGHRLESIPGGVPSAGHFPSGCRFAARCAYCTAACSQGPIDLADIGSAQRVRCIRHNELELGIGK